MGLQYIKSLKKKSTERKSSRSKNLYLNLLVKIYHFLSIKTKSRFNLVVLKRLFSSRLHQSQISLSSLIKHSQDTKKIIVVVGKVLNDERILDIPELTVCALKISYSAKERILKSGGKILTFDQLAKLNPFGKNTLLLRGRKPKKSLKKKRNLSTKKVVKNFK
jgi:large subunit ribosomal protein L18e